MQPPSLIPVFPVVLRILDLIFAKGKFNFGRLHQAHPVAAAAFVEEVLTECSEFR